MGGEIERVTVPSTTVDFVRERKEWPEPSHEEIMADIYRLQDEYARGLIDIAGRPIPDRKGR